MEGNRGSGHRRETGIRQRNDKVIFEEQDRRFAVDERRPVEGVLHIKQQNSRGSVDVYVRNLKRAAKPYKLFFIGRKDGSSVYKMVKEFVPDAAGDVSMHLALDPEDVDGEGTGLSCFFIFMIAAAGKPLRPVLKGDRQKLPKVDDLGKTPRDHGKEKRVIAESVKTYNTYYNEYISHKTADLMATFSDFTDISPFGDEWLADNWKCVTDVMKLPVASVGAEQQIRKYGHFIFGTTEKHFYLAVPGRHIEEEWPDRGKSGFVMWQSIRGSEEYGYWCMVIDCKTGIITEIS